jgi:hypothetical protein
VDEQIVGSISSGPDPSLASDGVSSDETRIPSALFYLCVPDRSDPSLEEVSGYGETVRTNAAGDQ